MIYNPSFLFRINFTDITDETNPMIQQIVKDKENVLKQEIISFIDNDNVNEIITLGMIYHPSFLTRVVNLPFITDTDPITNKDKQLFKLFCSWLRGFEEVERGIFADEELTDLELIERFKQIFSNENTLLYHSLDRRNGRDCLDFKEIPKWLIKYGAIISDSSQRLIYLQKTWELEVDELPQDLDPIEEFLPRPELAVSIINPNDPLIKRLSRMEELLGTPATRESLGFDLDKSKGKKRRNKKSKRRSKGVKKIVHKI